MSVLLILKQTMDEQTFFTCRLNRNCFVLTKQQFVFANHRYDHQTNFLSKHCTYQFNHIYRHIFQLVWHLRKGRSRAKQIILQNHQSYIQVFMYLHLKNTLFLIPPGGYTVDGRNILFG